MRTWAEGILAVTVVVAVGFALFLTTGESLTGDSASTVPVTADPEAAMRGAVLAEGIGCLQCHSVDGTPLSGPTWKGVAGSSRPLEGGETVIADDDYLRRSIVDPYTELLAGYTDVMPDGYGTQLTPEEIDDLVEYIKSLAA
jgi:cytochrome c1